MLELLLEAASPKTCICRDIDIGLLAGWHPIAVEQNMEIGGLNNFTTAQMIQ